MTVPLGAIASLAVPASVTMPAEMRATSGSTATLPDADTLTVRSALSLSAAMPVLALNRPAAASKAATTAATRRDCLGKPMLVLDAAGSDRRQETGNFCPNNAAAGVSKEIGRAHV